MYRLTQAILVPILLATASCAPKSVVVRDQLAVERLRQRATKVRNAINETRKTIAHARGAPYLPEIYVRLAELLSEEARYQHLIAYEREQRSSKGVHVPHVRLLKEQAIAMYRKALEDFPETPLADRILFNVSHEQRELGMFEEMLATLEDLVKRYPNSHYRAEALLVLGDYYFDQSDFAKASQRYEIILSESAGPLTGLAHYKQAWVHVNGGNCKKALAHFERAISAIRKSHKVRHQGSADASPPDKMPSPPAFEIPRRNRAQFEYAGHQDLDVAREALVDLTYCYARERKPKDAIHYLRRHATNREDYVAALTKLANRYALLEEPVGAAVVSRELLTFGADDTERLDDARMLHTAVNRMRDYSRVGEDVEIILRAMRRQLLRPNRDAASVERISREFELFARDLATRSHRMLTGALKRSKWSRKPAVPAQTIRAYETYLRTFPDAPKALEVVQNLADVLATTQRFLEAGHRYREAAELAAERIAQLQSPPPPKDDKAVKDQKTAKQAEKGSPSAGTNAPKTKTARADKVSPATQVKRLRKRRADALYNAVAAYQQVIDSEKEGSPLARHLARAGLRNAGGQYLAAETVEASRRRRIKFAIAQSYYDEGDYGRAIDYLSAVVYEYPRTRQANAAVHMVLDSYNTIGDMSGLISTGRRLTQKEGPLDKTQRASTLKIVAQAEQRRIDELSLSASGDEEGGFAKLVAFAARNEGTNLGERALISAFLAARARGDTQDLYRAGEDVLKKYPRTEQAAGIVSTMGRFSAASFDFDRAIRYLERAAAIDSEQRVSLLLAAGAIREDLADVAGAQRNYADALRTARGSERSEAAAKLAALLERTLTPQKLVAALAPWSKPFNPEVASRLGLALVRTGKYEEGESTLLRVTEGATAASDGAMARAYYGVAEVMMNLLEQLRPEPDISAIEETLGLVDMVLQAYIAAARQPDPHYGLAAMARLGRAAELGAEKIASLRLPSALSADEVAQVRAALDARAEQLRADSKAAVQTCAQNALDAAVLNSTAIACLTGTPLKTDRAANVVDAPPRVRATLSPEAREAQERLAKNPDDLDSLRVLASAFLDGRDFHAARLVLNQAVEAGGGAQDLNDLGVAAYRVGRTDEALDAFRRAKDAGAAVANANLATIYGELGLKKMAAEAQQAAAADGPGRTLRPGRSTVK